MKNHGVFRQFAGAFAASASLAFPALAQPSAGGPHEPPPNGPRHADPTAHVLLGATAHLAPGRTIENALIAIREGRIVRVGSAADGGGPDLEGYREWDASGLHVYPGLIDAWVEVEAPEPDPDAPGAHWNQMVMPQRSVFDGDGIPEKTGEALRKMGFVAAHVAPEGGVFRGTSGVVSLAAPPGEASAADPPVYREGVFDVVSFDTHAGREYPGSLMGAIALIRQTLIDVAWRRSGPGAGSRPVSALDAIGGAGGDRRMLFSADDELNVLRAAKIAREFDREAVIVGSGEEYRRFDAIVNLGLDLVVPLNFPDAPEAGTPGELDDVELRELMAWEQAPTNPRRLRDGGVTIALTSSKIKKRADFPKRLRKAIEHGLSEGEALDALTRVPAAMLGVQDDLGTIETGKIASFVVTDGPLFEEKTTIRDVWIDGRRHEITPPPAPDASGTWEVRDAQGNALGWSLVIKAGRGDKVSLTLRLEEGEREIKGRKVSWNGTTLSALFDNPDAPGTMIVSAVVEGDEMLGRTTLPGGSSSAWVGRRVEVPEEGEASDGAEGDGDAPEDGQEAEAADVPDLPGYPLGPYAYERIPPQRTIAFTGATIWTSGPEGILEDAWIVIEDGKIVAVGTGAIDARTRRAPEEIDARGKHITPGIIDAHSHTGMSGGVNEGSQAVTAEVRVSDITDPDTVQWYRQLAGGVTAVNTLHGSANPIGGQSRVSKLRWGAVHPDDMHMEGAPAGIKFALGENVKQSNWGDRFTTRYPQTRMGVETIIRDRFIEAREYLERGMRTADGRRDLELEALAEILAGERFVHCHSYRQDEILMLCRVAGDFGFTIGTFQHVLEGYKVAEAIREHAIGASCFSDWWAYKVEVQDAIPYNGAIMHDQGVVVSFNSDSSELARRLNTEAAKAVRYGGVEPAEALKFVTLNPAIQLGIDDRVGSLEPGKDADLVVWSGDPLSTLTRCERTFVDGREYFSLERDAELRGRIRAERERIIEKLIGRKKGEDAPEKGGEDAQAPGAPTDAGEDDPPPPEIARLRRELERHNLDLLRRGIDPAEHARGECGVTLHDLLRHED